MSTASLSSSPKGGDDLRRSHHQPSSREAILQAYKVGHRESRESKKQHHKVVIIENVRKRPHLVLKRQTTAPHIYPYQHTKKVHHTKHAEHEEESLHNYFKKMLLSHFQRQHSDRPEGWAAAKINRAIQKYHMIQVFHANRLPQYLRQQGKKLFDECCKCRPLAHGPTMSEDGVLQLAGPNLPRILRILRNKKNIGIDLLQPYGIAQLTMLHVAAQRGYTELVRELMVHWIMHPMESPYQSYSFMLLRQLLELVQQLRQMKALISESNLELQNLVQKIGVPFAHFSDAMEKLYDDAITLQDLIRICGHPLVLTVDAVGNTPLHYAAEGGYVAMCRLLIENGASINAQNNSGETPLHFAISSMHQDVCTFLVRNKADVRISRYVPLTLLNGVTLRGTFVDSPESHAICKVMPIFQSRSNALVNALVPESPTRLKRWFGKRMNHHQNQGVSNTKKHNSATVAPDTNLLSASQFKTGQDTKSTGPDASQIGWSPHSNSSTGEEGVYTRVESLASSPIFRDRNPRDAVYFRTAPGNSLIKPNVLCVFLVGDHVSVFEMMKSRDLHHKGKLFHLLIQKLPSVAVIAMDLFRTPLFRCSILRRVREYHQRWIVDNKLTTTREKRNALILLMKEQRAGMEAKIQRRNRRQARALASLYRLCWLPLKKIWKILRHVKRMLSVKSVFAATEPETSHKDSVICEPKGILYEYVYDHAEFRGGLSPTLSLILQTECKEILSHPWVSQLMDHKWNSFARQKFRSEFHLYFVYFISVFIATYLHVGDTLVGMPSGGYRANIFTKEATPLEYLRDSARILYSSINAHYTYEEFRSYRESGSLRAYLEDGWNWFDLLQISCVWALLATDIISTFASQWLAIEDFTLFVHQESLYNVEMWRVYNLRTTLMSIVGPQIFIKWIQFARGTQVLGPFVRMIFKMFGDIIVFLLVFGVFLCGFAFAFFILQLEGCKTFVTAILFVVQISLGAWDWDSIYEGGFIAVILFVLYAIIGTIMLLNLLIAMLGNTYDKIWEDRLMFFELERAKATLTIQMSLDDDEYDEKFWCQRLYTLEGDKPIEGIQFQKC